MGGIHLFVAWFEKFYIKHKQTASSICWWVCKQTHLSSVLDCTESQGLGTDLHFPFSVVQNYLQFSQMNDFQEKKRDKVLSVPLIPGVSSSWFLSTWFNHQTVFHVVPSSLWAESLYRHEILTVCLSVSPSWKSYSIPGCLVVVFSWMEIKGAKTQITSYRGTEKTNRNNSPPPFVPSWLKVTLFDA